MRFNTPGIYPREEVYNTGIFPREEVYNTGMRLVGDTQEEQWCHRLVVVLLHAQQWCHRLVIGSSSFSSRVNNEAMGPPLGS